ncbi:hypothetical protein TVNIR_3050 [Thioalkalivibrio nitratireducens DSM 14787]|uniref:Uncharacterized protein n=1 Tax=Thioalkalivibrio nitratireducens (strain DSM 14787 / UNIQEM 213 / ALEN2) TaxID=1255043 RepID=L0E0B2_THIND|nr:DsrE family protein [Thioalkalivibrio nitratireducens]AGA34687.1 hypothetical protein TVNIR_3050 [Thioalkalivibrio nitratireducens DSM 14787]
MESVSLRRLPALAILLLALGAPGPATGREGASVVQPDYAEPRVLFDFFFDHPAKIGPALYWLRGLINPLQDRPFNMDPEFMDIVVLIHGTELVTLARHNEQQYQQAVDRMRYYALLGVKFRVCGLALEDFGYTPEDLQPFVEVAPSAMTELAHWQQQGYALITPQVMERRVPLDEIR